MSVSAEQESESVVCLHVNPVFWISFLFRSPQITEWASQVTAVRNLPANAGDTRDAGSIPGSGRSPGVGNGNPLQFLAWKIPVTEEPGGL